MTNVRWVVIKTTFPLGDGQNSSYLVRNKTSIVSLANHPDKRIPYKYKLCVFRCLAYHRSKHRERLERQTLAYFSEFTNGRVNRNKFRVVHLTEMNKIENDFRINVREMEMQNSCIGPGVYFMIQ